MPRFVIALEGAHEAADAAGDLAAAVRRSPRPLLAELARQWIDETFPALFDRGGNPPWQPLSDVSRRLRGNSKPLEGQGILRNSFEILEISDFEAVVGTGIGEIHQFGGLTSPKSMIPDREIPARPFVGLDDSAISDAVGRISDFYQEGDF